MRMKTSVDRRRRSGCPISVALESIGDPWSLLIVRDLMFKGHKTYNDFLNAGEGIASNILADRLQRLEVAGIVTKHRDPADARRFIYRLTDRGIALAPLMVELVLWAAKFEQTDAPDVVVRAMTSNRDAFLAGVWDAWASSGA